MAPADSQSVRDLTLSGRAASGSPHRFDYVWAVVMDTAYDDGVLATIAYADGSSSMTSTLSDKPYVSDGLPALQVLAGEAIDTAKSSMRRLAPTGDTNFPPPGNVRIFVVGRDGVRATGFVPSHAIKDKQQPFYGLWCAMQNVTGLLRAEPTI